MPIILDNSAIAAMKVSHEALDALYQFWDGRRAGRRMPRRADFRAEDFRPWFGHIRIVAVTHTPRLRLKVVLSGIEVVRYDARDFTGRYLDEAVPPHALEAILAPYRCCIDDGVPVWDRISNPASKLYHALDRMLLPCAPDDRQVDKIIVGIYCDVEPRALDLGRPVYDLITPELVEQARSA